jgi:hypothetical protein
MPGVGTLSIQRLCRAVKGSLHPNKQGGILWVTPMALELRNEVLMH